MQESNCSRTRTFLGDAPPAHLHPADNPDVSETNPEVVIPVIFQCLNNEMVRKEVDKFMNSKALTHGDLTELLEMWANASGVPPTDRQNLDLHTLLTDCIFPRCDQVPRQCCIIEIQHAPSANVE